MSYYYSMLHRILRTILEETEEVQNHAPQLKYK